MSSFDGSHDGAFDASVIDAPVVAGTRVDAVIGRTPVVRLERVATPEMAEVWIKLEGHNPGGSIKDRTALGMILDAEARGVLKPGDTIVEPTSGNTGIGLAQVAAARGYRLILCLPDSASDERKRTLEAYGAELVLTDPERRMLAAIEAAEQIRDEETLPTADVRGLPLLFGHASPCSIFRCVPSTNRRPPIASALYPPRWSLTRI
jgi:threonine dehydratase